MNHRKPPVPCPWSLSDFKRMHKTLTLKVMSSKFVTVDRETPMLFPPDLREWVAEQADSTPLEDGLTIPEELSRREERKKKLKEARRIIEERYEQEKKDRKAEYEKQTAHREEMKKAGKKVGRKPGRPQDEEGVPDKMQVNFTDEESRIMRCGGGNDYEQCYNAQAVVDTEGSMLILASYITNHTNDKKELNPAIDSVDAEIREIESVCTDTGYYSEYAASTAENDGKGPRIYCAVERTRHHYGIEDIEKKDEKELKDLFLKGCKGFLSAPAFKGITRSESQQILLTYSPAFSILFSWTGNLICRIFSRELTNSASPRPNPVKSLTWKWTNSGNPRPNPARSLTWRWKNSDNPS